MGETGIYEALEPADSGFPRLKRKLYEYRWFLLVPSVGFTIFVLPDWGRGGNFEYTAWISSSSVALVIITFWSARRLWWFRIGAVLIVALHLVVLLSIHWTSTQNFGATYRAYGEIDFIATYAFMWIAQEIEKWCVRSIRRPKARLDDSLGRRPR